MALVTLTLRRLSSICPSLYTKNVNVINYATSRYLASDAKINWVRPPNVPSYDPSQSGDLAPFRMPDLEARNEPFASCELLSKTTNENVKKIFSLSNQTLRGRYFAYKMSLINKVKDHKYDYSSVHAKIADLTARIRIIHYVMSRKISNRKYRKPLNTLIQKRRKLLRFLRTNDYKRFEWLLEKLDLKYYSNPIKKEVVTRKKSTKLLAEFRKEKLKELKLAEYRKKLDLEKVPFLEKKLKTLQYIKDQESALQLQPTVTDPDIENCLQQIEKVKIQVEENQKKGYIRKVHPYTLEVYNPKIFEKSDTN